MDITLKVPWLTRRKPYIALHIKHWGWRLGKGRHRQIFVVMFMWGRQFMDSKCGGYVSFRPEIPWPR